MSKTHKQEVEDNWQAAWREILEKEDGSIDVEQLKLELMDYSEMIDRMSHLTCEVTRNRLSYSTYPVETILDVMQQCESEEEDDQRKEDLSDGVCHFCQREFEE